MPKPTPNTISSKIVDCMSVSALNNVYTLGNFAPRLTFQSQQYRALNLVWALFQEKKLLPGQNLCIVGGGLAGITAAFAAHQLKCNVTLFEQGPNVMHLQRGNKNRYVHPNIYDWGNDAKVEPGEGAEYPHTKLPYLNWSADMSGDIVRRIDRQWKPVAEQIKTHFGYKVTSIRIFQEKLLIIANKLNFDAGKPAVIQSHFDCVILAVGFGFERQFEQLKFESYWETNALEQPVKTAPLSLKDWLVIGCGDGGLIDALRLRLHDFDHSNFLSDLYSSSDFMPVKLSLGKIEKRAIRLFREEKLNLEELGIYLYQEYDKLKIPASLIKKLKTLLRSDTHVTLNSPNLSPMNFKSSIHNRFTIFLLLKYGDLKYHRGRVKLIHQVKNMYQVDFENNSEADGTGAKYVNTLYFHEIVTRIGADSVIEQLLSKESVKEARRKAEKNLYAEDFTRIKQWSDDFFPEITYSSKPPAGSMDYAAENKREFLNIIGETVNFNGFSIKEIENRVSYVVTLSPENYKPENMKLRDYKGIPIFYEQSSDEIKSQTASVSPPVADDEDIYRTLPKQKKILHNSLLFDYQESFSKFHFPLRYPEKTGQSALLLHYGIGIGFAENRETLNKPENLILTGTLGCFVKLDDNRTGFLSTNTVIANQNRGVAGSSVIYTFDGKNKDAKEIGVLHSFVPLAISLPGNSGHSERIIFNEVDAAVALLHENIEFTPQSIPGLPELKGTRSPQIGEKVFKIGRTSGQTAGIVTAVEMIVPVLYAEGQCWFRDSIEIKGVEDTPFSESGDGGAIVVGEDGMALGLIYAGAGQQTFACLIEPVLASLRCSLITS